MNALTNSIAVNALKTIEKASERLGMVTVGGTVLGGITGAIISEHSDKWQMVVGGAICGLIGTFCCMYHAFTTSNAVKAAREDLENQILRGLVRVQSEKINGREKWFICEADSPDNKQLIPVGSNLWTRFQARRLEKLSLAYNSQ